MNQSSSRPALGLCIPLRGTRGALSHPVKRAGVKYPMTIGNASGAGGPILHTGTLSPNLQPNTPPALFPRSLSLPPCPQASLPSYPQTSLPACPPASLPVAAPSVGVVDAVAAGLVAGATPCRVDDYILFEAADLTLPAPAGMRVYRAVHVDTREECVCKCIPVERHRVALAPYWHAAAVPGVIAPRHVVVGPSAAYAFFPRPLGDLHAHVRAAGRLLEPEARRLFAQIAGAVAQCHEAGLVLRDIKLRKCVFTDTMRSVIRLSGLEDAHILSDPADDRLLDKHGCPAYVSPEILRASPLTGGYSGRAADAWSLGVILYTMLVGRYPFQDSDPVALFSRISLCSYPLPDTLSPRARCLLRSLLRKDPSERLSALDALRHPWLGAEGGAAGGAEEGGAATGGQGQDQSVPEVGGTTEDAWFYE